MSRSTRTIITALAMFLGLVVAAPCFASTSGGGACPTAANYVNPSNPTGPLVTLSSLGVTGCYFVGSGGSDSNAGTSESSPWLHAPGMPNCSSTCNSASIPAGTGIILEGGMTYHVFAGTSDANDVPMGGTWTWNHSGSGSNPNYVGIDPTWYIGSSFARPIITQDNPLSTGTVSSCSHADGQWFSGGSPTNAIYDGFDLQGVCDTGQNGPGFAYGSNIVERMYAHGWTLTTSAGDDSYKILQGGSNSGRALFLVVDGSDSTYGTACTNWSTCGAGCEENDKCATGWAMSPCFDVEYSVIRHVSNGLECTNPQIIVGNLMEFVFNPSFGGRHGNIVEALGGASGNTCEYYGNLVRNTNSDVGWWLQCSTAYVFNNVIYNNGTGGPNCLIMSPPGSSDTAFLAHYNLANNTTDASCTMYAYQGNGATPYWATGSTITISNSHAIGVSSIFGSGALFSCNSPSSCLETDGGGEVIMPSSMATSQGYTVSDVYAPPSGCTPSTCGTVQHGISLSALCAVFSSDSALCSGTAKAVSEQAGWGGQVATYSAATADARGTLWDAGAYEYNSGATGPNPPSGLTATLQ